MEIIFTILAGLIQNTLEVFPLLILIPVILIGEITLFLVTLGGHKIRLDTYINPEGGVFTLLSETSVWVGLVVISIGGIAIKYIYFSHGSH